MKERQKNINNIITISVLLRSGRWRYVVKQDGIEIVRGIATIRLSLIQSLEYHRYLGESCVPTVP
jgi:hypothetical protein